MIELVSLAVVCVILSTYFWLRFGPKPCPKCGSLTWGYWGTPIGVRRMHFHCKQCGEYFERHWRLPL